MKKVLSVLAIATVSTMLMAGCESMSSNDQRIGAAALGGAVGGAAGNSVGGSVGAAAGAGATGAAAQKAVKTPAKKAATKKTAAPKATRKPAAGKAPSTELAAVIGAEPVARPEAVKKMWEYIKAHNLQDPKDKRTIVADDKLRAVFGKDSAGMFELAGILGKHLG